MKHLILLSLLSVTVLCYGQNSFALRTEAETIEEFVPRNWKLISKAVGDLNKDNVEDAALVIQEMNSKNILINPGSGIDTLDSNPRILVILLKDTISDKFKLKDISKTFILNHASPTMDDPFDGVVITNGVLGIAFHFWFSAGSWYRTLLEYKFRLQRNEFVLIGAEYDQVHRGTMEGVERSFNFLTRRMNETRTIPQEEVDEDGAQIDKVETEWKELPIKELKTIKTLTQPLDWTVLPDVSI